MFALADVRRHTRLITLALLMLALLMSLAPSPQLAAIVRSQSAAAESAETLGPQQGEVFKDFMDNAPAETAICNASPSKCNSIAALQTRSAPNVTLLNATRAESVFEYWGGHPGTTNQTFRINNGPWRAYPDIQGIPAGTLPTCYLRTPTNAIAAVPLTGSGAVRPSGNNGNTVNVTYNYQIGPQQALSECAPGTNQYWGMMWVYQATTRIYYDPAAMTHATGTITSPSADGTFSENPTITVSAQAPNGRTISRVDLIGNYLDYDWDGDGVMREWQYAMRRGVWERTIGTYPNPSGRTNASLSGGVYRFAWDTTWLPDQDQPVQLMARITDNTGVSYMTPLVSASFNRSGRSVRMYNTWSDLYGTRVFGPPRNYGMNIYTNPRMGWRTNISIGDALTNATRARFTIYTWSANPGTEDMDGDTISDTDNAATEVWVNSREMWPGARFGQYHDYSFDSVTFNDPQAFLNQGDNTLMIWSNRPNHKLEVLWPGPAVFVEYSTPPSTPNLSASDLTLSTNEDQALAVTLAVTNPKGAALSYSILTPPTLGTLSGDAPNLTYTPNANANGSDSFSFRVNDQYGNSAEATVSITIQSLPDPTVITLGEGALLDLDALFQRTINISDPDSASLVATVNYGDGSGDLPLTINANGSANLDHQYLVGGRLTLTVSVNDGGQTATATAIITVLTPGSPQPTAPWALNGWRYRFPLTANAGAYPRQNRVAEFAVNFTSALQNAGGTGALIPESIRVVEVDAGGAVINPNMPYQFDPVTSGYNATTNARGSLLVLMSGTTPANTSRRYQVYFETSGTFTAPTFAPLVVVTNPNLPNYVHDSAIVIDTRDPDGTRNSTYYYSRNGGALISLVDRSDANWITYSTNGDSAGAYRGVPNAGPVYHPGFYGTYPADLGNDPGSNQRSTTTIVREGPLRTIVRSISSNGQWESMWEFFPNTARMTMVRTPANAMYWWLYEGTPGGTLDWSDRWVRADGTTKTAYDTTYQAQERFHADLPGAEWVYFRAGEAALNGRAIWLANHNDADQAMDIYRQQNDGSGDPAAMTVFGFGRREYTPEGWQTLQAELQGVQTFSLGLYENAPSTFDANTGLLIEGRYRDLPPLSVGQGERQLSNLAPWAPGETYRTRVGRTLTVAAPGFRSNDSDGDGDTVSVALTTQPLSGILTFNSNGSFTYVPNAGFSGTDSFVYTATDGKNPAPPTTVTLRVTENEAPTVVGNSGTTNFKTALVVAAPGVLTGADDLDGDTLTAQLLTGPASGSLTLNPNGGYTYTPELDFVGVVSFTFAAYDGEDQSAPATVQITVTDPNHAPAAVVSSGTTNNETALVVAAPGVLAGASDIDGDTLTAQLITPPAHGTLVLNPNGGYTYTPQQDFVGIDSFTFAAYDGHAQSASVTVQITVTDLNHAPVAVASSGTTNNETALVVAAPGVLAGASDSDGDTLTAQVITPPAHGSLVLNPNGGYTYTPQQDFVGIDSFTFAAYDGHAQSAPATVQITVTNPNHAPAAVVSSGTTNNETALVVAAPGVLAGASDPDGDTLIAQLITPPAHGTLVLNPNGGYTYTPKQGFVGIDSFTFAAYDGHTQSAPSTVQITVTDPNRAPAAVASSSTTNFKTALVVAAPGVLASASDPDGDTLIAQLITPPAHGSLVLNPNGGYTYTPKQGFVGIDSFTFAAYDGHTQSAPSTVQITVTDPNRAPAAVASSSTTNNETVLVVAAPGVLAGASDPDGDTLTAQLITPPAHGSLVLNPNGGYTYTPEQSFVGTVSFTFVASDGKLTSSPATVQITVNAPQRAPMFQVFLPMVRK